jgi:hypothetical protein
MPSTIRPDFSLGCAGSGSFSLPLLMRRQQQVVESRRGRRLGKIGEKCHGGLPWRQKYAQRSASAVRNATSRFRRCAGGSSAPPPSPRRRPPSRRFGRGRSHPRSSAGSALPARGQAGRDRCARYRADRARVENAATMKSFRAPFPPSSLAMAGWSLPQSSARSAQDRFDFRLGSGAGSERSKDRKTASFPSRS